MIFKKVDSPIPGVYQYGIIQSVKLSSDGVIRTAVIRYRNASENVDRTTTRAVRTVVVIHRIDELNIMQELGNAALLGREIVTVAKELSQDSCPRGV